MTEPEELLPPEIILTATPELDKLFEAMAKAQTEITDAEKDSANPFFKSRYADLASVRGACVPAMAKNGICVMQFPFAEGRVVTIVTIVGHSSGQRIRSELTMTARAEDPQAIGSAITYGRRYSLGAISGVAAAEDDDGNAASGHSSFQRPAHQQTRPQQRPNAPAPRQTVPAAGVKAEDVPF